MGEGMGGGIGEPSLTLSHQGASSVSLPNVSRKPFSVFFLRAQRGWPFSSPFPFPPPRSLHAGTHLPGTPSRGARCSFLQAFNYCCKLKWRELREGGGRLLGGARPGDGGAGCTARGTQGIRALSEARGRWKCAVSFSRGGTPGCTPLRVPRWASSLVPALLVSSAEVSGARGEAPGSRFADALVNYGPELLT